MIDTASQARGADDRDAAVSAKRRPGIAPTALRCRTDGATSVRGLRRHQRGGGGRARHRANSRPDSDGLVSERARLSADGKYLAVATLLGSGIGLARRSARARRCRPIRGSIAVVEMPDAAQLADYTTAVAENNHMTLRPDYRRRGTRRQMPRPRPCRPAPAILR